MDWSGRNMGPGGHMGQGGQPGIRPGMINPQMMRQPQNHGIIQELSHRVNDVDQRNVS